MTDTTQAPGIEQPQVTEVPPQETQTAVTEDKAPPQQKTELDILREEKAAALKREERRVNALSRRAAESEAQAAAHARRIAELEAKLTQSASATAKPKLEDFKTYDEYVEAVADWRADQKVQAKLQEFKENELKGSEERATEERQARAAEAFGRALVAVEEAGIKQFPDFVDVVKNGPHLGPLVGDLVMRSEKAPEITYYLAKNPDVGLAIAEMPRERAAMEIGRLEAKLTTRKTTQAPPPTTTVNTSKGDAPQGLSDDLSTKEWIRRRNQQEFGRRKG